MADFTLVIGNKNYSSWSLRGWLMASIAGIDVRGDRDSARPAGDAGGDPQALAVGPGAGAAASRPRGLGVAGDRGISQRPQARGGSVAGRRGGARPCPLDLDRDACGLHGAAQQHADEHPRLLSRQGHDARRCAPTSSASPRSGATAASASPAPRPRTTASCSAASAPPTPCMRPVVTRFRTYGVHARHRHRGLLPRPCSPIRR